MRFLSLASLFLACILFGGCQSLRSDKESALDYSRTTEVVEGEVVELSPGGVETVSYEEEVYEVDEDPGFSIDKLSPEAIGTSFSKAIGQGPNRDVAKRFLGEADGLYDAAVQLQASGSSPSEYKKGFRKAGELYLTAAKRFPDSSIEQDALFRAGESFFFGDSYDKANECYEKLIQKYGGSRLVDKAEARRFAIAQYWAELQEVNPDHLWSYNFTNPERPARDTGGHARRVFNNIRLEDPTGKLADDATMALGNAYFRNGSYIDAADTYEDLRKAYPGSQHVFTASMLEIQSRLRAYRGPAYDGTGIEKADRLMESVVEQFPQQVQDQRTALDELAAEIRYQLADREMYLARLYDRRHENRAARLYYGKVVAQYSDTILAEEARERLAELQGKPELPKQKLKWLVDVLPESKDQKPLFKDDLPRR
jgi:outer membrane assembly lipoprotein YfiO